MHITYREKLMESVMKKINFLLFCILFTSCSFSSFKSKNQISVATWNVQTFFDAQNDGCEYQEFRKSDDWTKEKYEQRLERLCSVIQELDADVIVLEELENQGILYDISNYLAGNSWNQNKNWLYGCFAKNEGDSIGCGVLSRYELGEMKIHNLQIKKDGLNQPSMRPVVEVQVYWGEKQLTLLANHWKSKAGGSDESEIWRNWQEIVLGNRIKTVLENNDGCNGVIACGDFNRDLFEFDYVDGNKINIDVYGNEEGQIMKTCWLDENGQLVTDKGSYFFKDNWERIDHFFVSENVNILDFSVFAKEPWCNDEGIPLSYKIYTGLGYSDHVPLRCVINF